MEVEIVYQHNNRDTLKGLIQGYQMSREILRKATRRVEEWNRQMVLLTFKAFYLLKLYFVVWRKKDNKICNNSKNEVVENGERPSGNPF